MTNAYERFRAAVEKADLRLIEVVPGAHFKFQTPGHSGRTLDSHVKHNGDNVLFHCFDGDSDDVLEELGLTKKDFYDNPRGSDYRYSDGVTAIRRWDNEKKAFRQFKQICEHNKPPTKCDMCKDKSGLEPLFGLESLETAGVVYVLEGEKDQLTAQNLCGVAAVSQRGGGNQYPKRADWSQLAGRDVIIVGDDDKTGEKRAQAVFDFLQASDIPLTSLVITKPLVGNDFSDHIAADKTIQELVVVKEAEAVYPPASQPMKVAAALKKDIFSDSNQNSTIVFWRNDWWIHKKTHWSKVSELAVRGPIYRRLEDVKVKKDDALFGWAPTRSKVANIMEPLAILNHREDEEPAPGWLVDDFPAEAENVISLQNCLFDYTTRKTFPHTAKLFNTWTLPFEYDPNAQCPQWEQFVNGVFAHDERAGLAMQEWFGYVVSGRTDMQKGLLVIGPGGSGKGVMDRILQSLLGGTSNVVASSFQALSTNFGLSTWEGKSLAAFSDVRDGGSIPDTVVSRLLSVIGEDPVPIDVKNKDPLSVKLPTRVMIMSNELPSFRDSSSALVKRWLVIETAVSHRDKPDVHLEDRLRTELPGIFLWALKGLARLEIQGAFTTPDSTSETLEMMNDGAAPEAMFIQETYAITGDPDNFVWLNDVYASYELWTKRRGNKPLSQNRFKIKIKSNGLTGITITKKPVGNDPKNRKEAISGIYRANFQKIDSTDSTQLAG